MSLGVIFALLGALSFGMNGATVRRGVAQAPASQGLYITIFVGWVMFVIAALLSGQLFEAGDFTARNYLLLAAGGIVHIMAGRYCNYRAVAAMGANRAGPVIGTSTLAAVIIAVVWLDEVITPLKAVGILLVMVGPALVARRRRRQARVAAPAPAAVPAGASPDAPLAAARVRGASVVDDPRLKEGYFFGVMGALFWGAGPVLMRAGLGDSGLGVFGGVVTYGAAGLVLMLSLAIPGQLAGAVALDRSSRMWFLASAGNSFFANLFRMSALALAPVSVVVPLMRISTLAQMGFNFIFNRRLESYERRVLAGIAVSLVGATLLVL
ncbi:MAG: DMT family transporter [Chloroflexota bacterium]